MPNNNNKDINQILQSCLEAIQSGEETIGSILARYPEFERELRPQLETAYWLMQNKEAFNPNPDFISASRGRLLAQIGQESAAGELGSLGAGELGSGDVERRLGAGEQQLTWWERLVNLASPRLAVQFAVALLLLVFLFAGSSRAVLAARNALPGDTLYGVKIAQERVQVLVTLSSAGDARLHTRFAQRRLLELEELVLENRYEYVEDTVEAYEVQVNAALANLREVASQDPEQVEQIGSQLQAVLTEQTTVLAILSESVPEDTRSQLERAMDVSAAGVVAANEIIAIAVAQTTATPTSTVTTTFTPTATTTGLAAAALTQAATTSATPSASPTPSGTVTQTATLGPGASGTFTPTPTRTSISGGAPTATATDGPPVGPTNTPTNTGQPPPGPTASPTATQVSPPSSTATATQPGVPAPSATTAPPTATFTPTSQPPTATWTPSPTSVAPTPTNTPVPPPTDTPVVCSLSANFFDLVGNKIDVRVNNGGQVKVIVTGVTLDWPAENEELKEVQMDGRTIWTGTDDAPPSSLSEWSGDVGLRVIGPGSSGELRFIFKRAIAAVGYAVAIQFDNGCSATANR